MMTVSFYDLMSFILQLDDGFILQLDDGFVQRCDDKLSASRWWKHYGMAETNGYDLDSEFGYALPFADTFHSETTDAFYELMAKRRRKCCSTDTLKSATTDMRSEDGHVRRGVSGRVERQIHSMSRGSMDRLELVGKTLHDLTIDMLCVWLAHSTNHVRRIHSLYDSETDAMINKTGHARMSPTPGWTWLAGHRLNVAARISRWRHQR